jgi:hypothetical protein
MSTVISEAVISETALHIKKDFMESMKAQKAYENSHEIHVNKREILKNKIRDTYASSIEFDADLEFHICFIIEVYYGLDAIKNYDAMGKIKNEKNKNVPDSMNMTRRSNDRKNAKGILKTLKKDLFPTAELAVNRNEVVVELDVEDIFDVQDADEMDDLNPENEDACLICLGTVLDGVQCSDPCTCTTAKSCKECLQAWVISHPSCPTCRRSPIKSFTDASGTEFHIKSFKGASGIEHPIEYLEILQEEERNALIRRIREMRKKEKTDDRLNAEQLLRNEMNAKESGARKEIQRVDRDKRAHQNSSSKRNGNSTERERVDGDECSGQNNSLNRNSSSTNSSSSVFLDIQKESSADVVIQNTTTVPAAGKWSSLAADAAEGRRFQNNKQPASILSISVAAAAPVIIAVGVANAAQDIDAVPMIIDEGVILEDAGAKIAEIGEDIDVKVAAVVVAVRVANAAQDIDAAPMVIDRGFILGNAGAEMNDTHDEICQKAIAKNVEEIAINLRNLSVNGYDSGMDIIEFYEKTCVAMSYTSEQLSGDPAISPARISQVMDQLSVRLKEDLDDDAHERYADQCADECDREQMDEDRRMDQNKRKKH